MISELISNMHDQIREKENKQKVFKDLFDHTLLASGDSVPAIEYKLPYPKEDFLRFLVSENGVLLHGSSNRDMEVLEPKQANDSAKMSGNKKAVYCVSDPVLPIFYAIKDRDKFQNVIVSSGVLNNLETGDEEYHFRIPKSLLEIKPWTRGFVYILDKNKFNPEKNDKGDLSGEWTSGSPVKPLAKLEVGPEDFRFLDKVEGGE